MFRKQLPGFLGGVAATALAVALVLPAFADVEYKWNSVNISVNEEQVAAVDESYTLDNGASVPFSIVYEGTTYLPIRKLTELTGLSIDWISASNTVAVSTGDMISRAQYETEIAALEKEVNDWKTAYTYLLANNALS